MYIVPCKTVRLTLDVRGRAEDIIARMAFAAGLNWKEGKRKSSVRNLNLGI